ncbi:MAG: hypothetical protein DI539_25375 [Flavobacterium psychrophilum]|nr:MAG: hypothetical protein DI539_25375 [Flavobacterium psychrophilum]
MADRVIYHVMPHEKGGWAGKKEGSNRSSVRSENKADVVERTLEMAQTHPLSQVIIHKMDGTIQEERTFGNDPHPPKG